MQGSSGGGDGGVMHSRSVCVIADAETRCIAWLSRGAELMFGYPTTHAFGQPIELLFPDRRSGVVYARHAGGYDFPVFATDTCDVCDTASGRARLVVEVTDMRDAPATQLRAIHRMLASEEEDDEEGVLVADSSSCAPNSTSKTEDCE